MEHFKDLLTVRDEDEMDLDGKLEQSKAYALDEIFTDNTNLSLNVQEDEILGGFWTSRICKNFVSCLKISSAVFFTILQLRISIAMRMFEYVGTVCVPLS